VIAGGIRVHGEMVKRIKPNLPDSLAF